MTDIQQPGHDARLEQALQHMPDAHMQADSATRLAILQAAQEAIAPQAPTKKSGHKSGWKRWFNSGAASEHKIPWATAITSVLIVGFVGVLWHDRELPDAIPDGPAVAEKQAAPTATPAPALPPAAPTAPAAPAMAAASPPPLAHDKVTERAAESIDARLDRPLRQVPSQATISSDMAGGLHANKADSAATEKLLQALRALPCPAAASNSPPNNNTPAWVVEGTYGEVWTITPSSVSFRGATRVPTLTPTQPRICAISAERYAQLRQLVH